MLDDVLLDRKRLRIGHPGDSASESVLSCQNSTVTLVIDDFELDRKRLRKAARGQMCEPAQARSAKRAKKSRSPLVAVDDLVVFQPGLAICTDNQVVAPDAPT